MKHKYLVIGQLVFLVLAVALLFFLYPRAELELDGDRVSFKSINAKIIMISENPDLSNPRYIDLSERKNISFNLKPGKYYWKSDNGIIEGLKNEFVIESEVGLGINKSGNESKLVNVGNVRVNITETDGGVMVGHIILEPGESEKIDDSNEKYIGRQER